MKLNTLLIFILLLPIVLFGQEKTVTRLDGSQISSAAIDEKVKQLMEGANVQGLNLAILNNNKIAYIKSYGYRNKPQNTLLDTASIVYGASLSKAVFGYLVMKLVDEGTIDLDKPLFQYLKKPIAEYEYFSDLKNDDRCNLITARMCLSHTTGLPNVRWFDPTGTNPELDTLGVIKIYFSPGSKYAYSGEGFKLLQLAIEETTGKNIDSLAVEKIFKPMGMTRTGYIWHESFGDDNVAVGHASNGGIDLKRKRTVPVAGGSMVTTLADYTRFTENIMQKKGLTKKSYEEMIYPQISIHSKVQFPPITTETTTENEAIGLSYGLGWGIIHCENYGKAFFKEGNGETWRNYTINFPEKGIAIVILANSDNGENVFQEIIETAIGKTCIPWKWNGYTPFKTP